MEENGWLCETADNCQVQVMQMHIVKSQYQISGYLYVSAMLSLPHGVSVIIWATQCSWESVGRFSCWAVVLFTAHYLGWESVTLATDRGLSVGLYSAEPRSTPVHMGERPWLEPLSRGRNSVSARWELLSCVWSLSNWSLLWVAPVNEWGSIASAADLELYTLCLGK